MEVKKELEKKDIKIVNVNKSFDGVQILSIFLFNQRKVKMDKLISLVATLVLLGLYKILEYFHLFKTLQLILVFLMICAFCYGISPIFKIFGLFNNDTTSNNNNDNCKETKKQEEDIEREEQEEDIENSRMSSESEFYLKKALNIPNFRELRISEEKMDKSTLERIKRVKEEYGIKPNEKTEKK